VYILDEQSQVFFLDDHIFFKDSYNLFLLLHFLSDFLTHKSDHDIFTEKSSDHNKCF